MGALSIEDRHVGTIEAIAPKLDTTEAEVKTDGLYVWLILSPERDALEEIFSGHRKTYALPEEDTLFLNETQLEEIADRPYYIFENGTITEVPAGKAH